MSRLVSGRYAELCSMSVYVHAHVFHVRLVPHVHVHAMLIGTVNIKSYIKKYESIKMQRIR